MDLPETDVELPPELASLGVGDSVFYKNIPAKIVWDGRPEHNFVKVKWESGPKPGQTRMVSLGRLTLTQKVDKLGAIVQKAKEHKYKPPHPADSVRRRRA